MPCLEVSVPALDVEVKAKLAERLTEAFCGATGHDAGIFGIRFFEYGLGSAAQGGKLWRGDGVPYLHFLLYCPRLSRNQKQQVVESLSSAFTDVTAKPDWVPVIHIAEHPYDNVGVGGTLLTEAYPILAEREFYYRLQ